MAYGTECIKELLRIAVEDFALGSVHGGCAKENVAFTLTCSEETLKKRHDKRGDKGETNYFWLHLPPYPGDIVIDTDNKTIRDVVKEMKKQIDSAGNESNH